MWDLASVEALELSKVACDLCRQISDMFMKGTSRVSDITESIDQVLVDFDNGSATVVVDIVNDKILLVDDDFALLRFEPDFIGMVGPKIDIPEKSISLSVGMPNIKSILQVKPSDFLMNRDYYDAIIVESVNAIDSMAISKVVDEGLTMGIKVKTEYRINQTPDSYTKN